jgi:hypothetical protein
MPANVRAVELKLPEAVLLADLYEITFDLNAAEALCAKAIALERSDPRDYNTEQGLVEAAIVKYGRCFTKGVRLWLKENDLAELEPEILASHNYFIALRNKFVAHAVNAFEETFVTVPAREEDGTLFPITSVHPGSHRMLLTAETATPLLQLASRVRDFLKDRTVVEEQKLLKLVQSLPLEVIHAGDLHSPSRMKEHEVHKPRKRGVHSNNALQRDASVAATKRRPPRCP